MNLNDLNGLRKYDSSFLRALVGVMGTYMHATDCAYGDDCPGKEGCPGWEGKAEVERSECRRRIDEEVYKQAVELWEGMVKR